MKQYVIVTGARPNFMKVAPLCAELDRNDMRYVIFHSGQHYDKELSSVFIEQFGLKNIHCCKINTENKVVSMEDIAYKFKEFLQKQKEIQGVIVVGDVDTSFICSLVTKRLGLPLIHIEAGLRSFDDTMPEERNRITIDHLSDILFTTTHIAEKNLYNEGIEDNVFLVGNIMIDCLYQFFDKIETRAKEIYDDNTILVTFHRPENVDTKRIEFIVDELRSLSYSYNIIFSIHPRTQKKIESLSLSGKLSKCKLVGPMSYIDFLAHVLISKAVVTDSGGIQEETTVLGVPCFTVRKTTERPETILDGTNKLIEINDMVDNVMAAVKGIKRIPALWDGDTAKRIVKLLKEVA